MTSENNQARYSKAFERLVNSDDDLTGLLAYALYKQSIREASSQGRTVYNAGDRDPTGTEIAAYRNSADGLLATFAQSVVEQSKATLIDTAVRTDIGRLESSLTSAIRSATAWRTAIVTNLIAWLVSIAITFLVVFAGVPRWITALLAASSGP